MPVWGKLNGNGRITFTSDRQNIEWILNSFMFLPFCSKFDIPVISFGFVEKRQKMEYLKSRI